MTFDSRAIARSMPRPARLGVLISGGGRTLCTIHDAICRGRLHASIELVVASRPCRGVERARERGLPAVVEPGRIPRDRLADILKDAGVDLVALAGYLQLVEIPEGFEQRIVNIHPALLPRFGGPGFYGDRVHRAVLESGSKISGCTVHLCDEQYDHGPIILQRTCPVLPADTVDTLAARVFALEKQAYVSALQLLVGPGVGHKRRPACA